MLRYPLSVGTPNAVQCSTPVWDLRGNETAPAKLDIALNGQDFKGSLDFTFSSELRIHRTIPMAGPIDGNTQTRIIGNGFKPTKTDVRIKWGTISSDSVPKALV